MKTLLYSLLYLSLVATAQAKSLLPIEEIAPGIYVHFGKHQWPNKHNHGAIANIGFVVGEKCVAVIDSGGNPQQGFALKHSIQSITTKPVCYVINTHVHPDHIYGNIAFKNDMVKFVGHHKLPRAIAMRGGFYQDKSLDQIGIKITGNDLIAPDILVENELTLNLGKRKLHLKAHGTAHTDNDLSIYDEKTDSLWLSDLLFLEHLPVLDGSLKGWLQELTVLEKQAFSHVIPGHGSLVNNWPQAMQAQKRYLQTLLHEIRIAIKKGVYLEDAMETVGWSEKANWQLFEQFHRKNISTAFAELEWED